MTNHLIWMFVALLVIVVGRGLWVFFGHGNTARLKLSEELKVLISISTGLLLAINAVYLYEIQSDKNNKDTFQGAVEHLGSDSESVRLGGIYALYGLADKPRYKKDVHEILCAHIRSKTKKGDYQKEHKNKPSTEIQALLGLLSGKSKSQVFDTKDEPLKVNLHGAYLRGADLQDTQLQGATLDNAQLQGIDLRKAQLQSANLRNTQLQHADLQEAQLQGVKLQNTQLQHADLRRAQLQRANFQNTQLQHADLREAQLQSANLRNAQLQGADLQVAQLQGAYLRNAQLQGADLAGAQLQGADLWDAQLQGTNLILAQLQGADLQGAQLQGAYLRNAQLQGTYSTDTSYLLYVKAYSAPPFAERIKEGAGKETNLDTVVFAGGMSVEDLKEIERNMDLKAVYWDKDGRHRYKRQYLRLHLRTLKKRHVNKDKITGADKKSSQYLEGSETGSYTAEEAEQWIVKYNKAMDSYK